MILLQMIKGTKKSKSELNYIYFDYGKALDSEFNIIIRYLRYIFQLFQGSIQFVKDIRDLPNKFHWFPTSCSYVDHESKRECNLRTIV